MNDNMPTCYPYLHGYLEQSLKSLSRELIKEGFVDRAKQEELEKLIYQKIDNAHKAEREHSKKYPP